MPYIKDTMQKKQEVQSSSSRNALLFSVNCQSTYSEKSFSTYKDVMLKTESSEPGVCLIG